LKLSITHYLPFRPVANTGNLFDSVFELIGIGIQRFFNNLLNVVRELEAFAAFGSDLDAATQKQLTRGQRLVEILKQPQYQPLSMEKQVTILYAGTKGYLDEYPTDVVAKYEAGLYPFIEDRFPNVFTELADKQEFTDEITKLVDEALTAYAEEFKDTIK